MKKLKKEVRHPHSPCLSPWTSPRNAPGSPPGGHTSCRRRPGTSRRLDTAEEHKSSDQVSEPLALLRSLQGGASHLLYNVSLLLKDPGVVLMDVLLPPVLHTDTRERAPSVVILCISVSSACVCVSDHRVVEDLPHVRMEPGCVEVVGGQQTTKLVSVGHEHENPLRAETRGGLVRRPWEDPQQFGLVGRCSAKITWSLTLLENTMSGSMSSSRNRLTGASLERRTLPRIR